MKQFKVDDRVYHQGFKKKGKVYGYHAYDKDKIWVEFDGSTFEELWDNIHAVDINQLVKIVDTGGDKFLFIDEFVDIEEE